MRMLRIKPTRLSQSMTWVILAMMVALTPAMAAESSGGSSHHFGTVFLMMAIVLMAGKLGNIVERFGQPPVIGELLAGILLAVAGYLGFSFIGDIIANENIAFIASLGALILLFSIGLESNIAEMSKVGARALLVALIGVVTPFAIGVYVLGPLLFPNETFNAHLFLGASLVATSVGITASVFRSLGISKTRAAQTVLGAAVIDDVLGLIVLAVVSALASGGEATPTMVATMAIKSFGFLAIAIIAGRLLAGPISQLFSYVSNGVGMKLSVALALALTVGYLAELFGLEAIIGAFAAGLVLDAVHFRHYADPEIVEDLKKASFASDVDVRRVDQIINKHRHSHIEDLINPLSLIFVPIFFVYTGMQIDIASLLKPELYLYALIISVLAIMAKVVAGAAAQGSIQEKLLVGVSMVPRGEVGLIFASTGAMLGVLTGDLFSVIIMVVIITTLVSPPVITKLVSKSRVTSSQ